MAPKKAPKMKSLPPPGPTFPSAADPVTEGIRMALKNDRWLLMKYLVALRELVAQYQAKYGLQETDTMWQEIEAMAPPANLPADPDANDSNDLKDLRGKVWNNQCRDLGIEHIAILIRIFRENTTPLTQQQIQTLFAFLIGGGGFGPRLP